MIDLHCHTVHSDGSDTVKEILTKANQINLSHFSITDHNSVDAYFQSDENEMNSIFKGKLIPGIEITTTYRGEIIEVLGYGIDVNQMKSKLPEYVLSFEQKQLKEFELIKQEYSKRNVIFDEKQILFDPKKTSCRKSFYNEIIKYPENIAKLFHPTSIETSSKFTRQEVYNPSSEFYVDESSLYPSLKEVTHLIHFCGGIAILAHLYLYANCDEIENHLLKIVGDYQLDGVECYYSTFSKEQSLYLEKFCIDHHLIRSGGSDYHGTRKPSIELGVGTGSLKIPSDLFDLWPTM
ncbi:MAG: PHP domain-containing protein [Erysipelothrix sp.]|nr:PHP domain-containing protein [Erysipelothrix sp.]